MGTLKTVRVMDIFIELRYTNQYMRLTFQKFMQ
jgi:hypothetical protein